MAGTNIVRHAGYFLVSEYTRVRVLEPRVEHQSLVFRVKTSFKFRFPVRGVLRGAGKSLFIFTKNSEMSGEYYELNLDVLGQMERFPFITGRRLTQSTSTRRRC